MNLNTIFFIGPQGSGKGTQAKLLAKALGFFYWEMGGILRALKNEQTELAKKVTEQIDQGILLGDDLLLEVVKSKLSEIPKDQGVIFDGIPRRLGQAEFLLNALKEQGRTNFTTLFVDLPKKESVNRLLKRGEIEGRADDTKEKIEFRLEQYYNDTLPVIDFLRKNTSFFEIDGTPPIDEVTTAINKALKVLQ
jgi:adenylate kinase